MTTTKHGGRRVGAGRPATGTTKKVSITLIDETWDKLEQDKQDKNISQSAVLRSIIEDHYEPVNKVNQSVDERSMMWWELARKNIFEGYVEIKKNRINECIEHRRYSRELANEVYKRCKENSREYKNPRVWYLFEAFLFEGEPLLLDQNFESLEEQTVFSIIEYVRKNRKK